MWQEYHVIHSFWYYLRFHVTAVGLGTYCIWRGGHCCSWPVFKYKRSIPSNKTIQWLQHCATYCDSSEPTEGTLFPLILQTFQTHQYSDMPVSVCRAAGQCSSVKRHSSVRQYSDMPAPICTAECQFPNVQQHDSVRLYSGMTVCVCKTAW
jgi:hypothetical protein